MKYGFVPDCACASCRRAKKNKNGEDKLRRKILILMIGVLFYATLLFFVTRALAEPFQISATLCALVDMTDVPGAKCQDCGTGCYPYQKDSAEPDARGFIMPPPIRNFQIYFTDDVAP